MKLIILLFLLFVTVSCATNKPPKYHVIYMCETAEWDYFYRIYEKSDKEFCTYSTRIHGGNMIAEFWDMDVQRCKAAVKKIQTKKKSCCYVEKSGVFDTGKMKSCPGAMDTNPRMSI